MDTTPATPPGRPHFVVSWEKVCIKIGGIYTVLSPRQKPYRSSTKAKQFLSDLTYGLPENPSLGFTECKVDGLSAWAKNAKLLTV